MLGLPLLVLSGVAFAAYRYGWLVAPARIEGIPCGVGWVAKHPGGTLRSCTLASDVVVQGLELPAGSKVDLLPSGRLTDFRLGREATIANARLPAGATAGVTPDGRIRYVFLPHDMEIQGHFCRGGGHDWMTTFHPDGSLDLCWLAQDEAIRGIPCVKTTFVGELTGGTARTRLRPDGTLASCRLSRAVMIAGQSFREGERVAVGSDGTIAPHAK